MGSVPWPGCATPHKWRYGMFLDFTFDTPLELTCPLPLDPITSQCGHGGFYVFDATGLYVVPERCVEPIRMLWSLVGIPGPPHNSEYIHRLHRWLGRRHGGFGRCGVTPSLSRWHSQIAAENSYPG